MATSITTAIGDASRALCQLLEANLQNTGIAVTLLAPDDASHGSGQRINLFLYKVQENPELKNLDWQVKPLDNKPAKQMPPLALNLFYLMTSYASPSEEGGPSVVHDVLGQAMQVFYQNPVIANQDRQNGYRELVKIMLCPLDMEELNHLWSSFGQPYRLSVLYEVSVVQLVAQEFYVAKPVEIGGINLSLDAPYHAPVLDRIEPERDGDSVSITVFGQHLSGWHPKVALESIKERKAIAIEVNPEALEKGRLKRDIFTCTTKEKLQPGVFRVNIEIADYCRRTFYFEVKQDVTPTGGS